MDTDIGQPEFTVPGCISLHVLNRPVVGTFCDVPRRMSTLTRGYLSELKFLIKLDYPGDLIVCRDKANFDCGLVFVVFLIQQFQNGVHHS